jgi:AcrR family transcriptional regulator
LPVPLAEPAPDGRRLKGDRTRHAILRRAVDLASVDGLEGLTIGRLAGELALSKSGLFAHFGSKEELQLSTVRAAGAIFAEEVVAPALERSEPGIARLLAVLEAWGDYIEREVFAGGCFFAAVSTEVDGQPDGPVRDAVVAQTRRWERLLTELADDAIERGEFASGTDPAQLAFELDAFGTAVNGAWQLLRDPGVFERGRRAIRSRLQRDATEVGRAALAAGGSAEREPTHANAAAGNVAREPTGGGRAAPAAA